MEHRDNHGAVEPGIVRSEDPSLAACAERGETQISTRTDTLRDRIDRKLHEPLSSPAGAAPLPMCNFGARRRRASTGYSSLRSATVSWTMTYRYLDRIVDPMIASPYSNMKMSEGQGLAFLKSFLGGICRSLLHRRGRNTSSRSG